QVSKSP
ncbi:hypothetical protein VCPCS023_003572B, partial [Vibrio cholerae O1 str. PCS-023]